MTYRRARTALLASGSVELVNGVGGRGNTNVWTVRDPREIGDAVSSRVPRRVAPPAGARPLIASARSPAGAASVQESATEADGKGGHDRTLTCGKQSDPDRGFHSKGRSRSDSSGRQVSSRDRRFGRKGRSGSDTFRARAEPCERPAQTPAETPAANARAGREPLNPRIREDPPSPPEGGSPPDSILIEETYVTAHGRQRRRAVRIDLDEVRRGLAIPGVTDRQDWEQIREALRELVGESTFEIWLDPLELIAIDPGGALVVDAPSAMFSWLRHTYGRMLGRCAEEASRRFRFAEKPERHAFAHRERALSSSVRAVDINQREVS